eukprot:TRINITY_DN2144_c0_g1_i6.p1 TRINITY_DN2144_c0_g1~~TRINITY_DN2144_c0_g1_i6.p1  ORF type:complete len:332 (+),score=92.46 TRINITY_DN2144_c0_g1_i6:107-1102(+)
MGNAYKEGIDKNIPEELKAEAEGQNDEETQYYNSQGITDKHRNSQLQENRESVTEQKNSPIEKIVEDNFEMEPLHEGLELTEEQIIEITGNCFQNIAQYMRRANLTIDSLFKSLFKKEVIENEEFEVITVENFFNIVDSMPIQKLTNDQKQCLIQVLTMNDNEDFIEINDLFQVFENYGITDKTSANKQPKQDKAEETKANASPKRTLKQFEELDKVSMVLMLALAEYLIKADISMCDLFDSYIYTRAAEEGEVLHSGDFFKVLCEIGIKTDEDEHENLKSFLVLPSSDSLSVDKLTDALTQFATNKDLRAVAHEYYMEMINEDEEDVSAQ